MKIDAVIQARVTSSRFPYKVLTHLGRELLIDTLVGQLLKVESIGDIIIAIPQNKQNEVLKKHLMKEYLFSDRVHLFLGDEDDVTQRILSACEVYDIPCFFRICADSPLIIPWVFNYCANVYLGNRYDYLKTIGLPLGQNIEIVNTHSLKKIYGLLTQEEREHVTLYFERHCSQHLTKAIDLGKMCIDSPDDYKFFKEIENYVF